MLWAHVVLRSVKDPEQFLTVVDTHLRMLLTVGLDRPHFDSRGNRGSEMVRLVACGNVGGKAPVSGDGPPGHTGAEEVMCSSPVAVLA